MRAFYCCILSLVLLALYPSSATAQSTPPLRFATYLGGTASDAGTQLSFDAESGLYVAGFTASSDFPQATGSHQGGFFIGSDAFLARLRVADGTVDEALLLGGSDDDSAVRVLVDPDGLPYLLGITASADLPVDASLTPYGGGLLLRADGFVAGGADLDIASYLGGSGDDSISDGALGPDGDLYVVGMTSSDDLPATPGAFQAAHAGGGLLQADAFVARLRFTGDGFDLVYLTYLGGTMDDLGTALAVDVEGRAWIAGSTNSAHFPTANAFQPDYAGPLREIESDGFLARLSADGTRLDVGTYLGGRFDDRPTTLVLGADDQVYLAGLTLSPDFPVTPDAFQPERSGAHDAFIARVAETAPGTWALTYSTYLGGPGSTLAVTDLAPAPDGNLWIAAHANAADLPPEVALDGYGGGPSDALLLRLDTEGVGVGAFLGGSQGETGGGLALRDDVLCMTGSTASTDFPATTSLAPADTSNAFVACYDVDAFVTHADAPVATPQRFALHTNYPNPFQQETAIGFDVAHLAPVELTVIDALGRKVAVLVDDMMPAGYHEVSLNARHLASGLYFYRIEMGGFRAVRPMMLVR